MRYYSEIHNYFYILFLCGFQTHHNIRGAMNCATTNVFYANEKGSFRKGIT